MMLLVKITPLTSRSFSKYRKHFIVLAFVVAMFLTPPDAFTQTLLAVPMILLYEFGIVLTKFASRKNPSKIKSKDLTKEQKIKVKSQIEKNTDSLRTAQRNCIAKVLEADSQLSSLSEEQIAAIVELIEKEKTSKPEGADNEGNNGL